MYCPLVHKFASYRVDNLGNLFIFHFPVLVLMHIVFQPGVLSLVAGSRDDVLLEMDMLDGGHRRRCASEDRRETRSWASTGSGSPCSLTILNLYLER